MKWQCEGNPTHKGFILGSVAYLVAYSLGGVLREPTLVEKNAGQGGTPGIRLFPLPFSLADPPLVATGSLRGFTMMVGYEVKRIPGWVRSDWVWQGWIKLDSLDFVRPIYRSVGQ